MSAIFVSEDSIKNKNSNMDTAYGGMDASAVVKKIRYSNNNKEYFKMHPLYVDQIKFTNMDSKPHTSVEISDFEEYATITETNYEDDTLSCVDSTHSGKPISFDTAAQLSAQIMNLPLEDFKETISGEQIRTLNVYDILKRLREAYNACTCKICECIVGKPDDSQSQPCSKSCDSKDCDSSRTDEVLLDEVKNTSCSCQPCECINCAKLNKSVSVPCNCEPCQCLVCKGMAVRRDKMVIVAPVRQGSQRPNCLCTPCDCPRCRQRTLNMSLSRMHEMSTGVNRHPNCHCEVCIDDSCQPNGTAMCNCQVRRHGVIRKPVEKNPHDFDIRRTIVLNNATKTVRENASICTFSLYSAFEKKNYPSYNCTKVSTSECDCSMCGCIACGYKDNPTNSKTFLDKSLRTLKLPSADFKACKCSPCECLRCTHKKYEFCKESEHLKSCSCNICDCLNCEGATKPGNAVSSIIPVAERLSNKFEPTLQCNDSWKLKRHSDVCHCDLCRCITSPEKGDVSEEGLYPIKKGERLTPSRMRTDPISELELLSPSSEYTHLKHSKGQSNVFRRESGRTKPKFTVLHLVPRLRTKKLSLTQTTPSESGLVEDKLNSSGNILRVELPQLETVTHLFQYYRASTSKTLSAHGIVKTTDDVCSHQKSETESDETACLYDSTRANNGREYQNSPSTSASSSKLEFQHPTPFIRPLLKKKVDQLNEPSEVTKKASSKEVSFVPCNNIYGDEHGGALHDVYGTHAMMHNTYIYTAMPSSNFNAEENAYVSEEPFNKDDYILENKFYWNLDHSCTRSSENTIDYQLLNNETYKTALTTLEKSRNFSLELTKLLEQYETANLEFESISQKLKQSLDDFELCNRTSSLAQNDKNKIPNTVDSSSSTFIKKKSSTHSKKTSLKMQNSTNILEATAISQAENVSAEICEQSKQIDNRTESHNSSTTGLICLIDAELRAKNYLQPLNKQLMGSKEVKLFQFNTKYADEKREDLALLIKRNIKPKNQKNKNILNEYVIDIHKGTNGRAPRIFSRVITNLKTPESTKLKKESTPKFYLMQDEACKPIHISSDIDRKSSSYCSTQALDATTTNSERKVQFSSVRRVSDHSVLIKWETPNCVKDVEGYEILVDGRAAQKIFSPARCMAVVTCLPRAEPVLLTIRTLTNDRSSGVQLPCASISYRPRGKSLKKIVSL